MHDRRTWKDRSLLKLLAFMSLKTLRGREKRRTLYFPYDIQNNKRANSKEKLQDWDRKKEKEEASKGRSQGDAELDDRRAEERQEYKRNGGGDGDGRTRVQIQGPPVTLDIMLYHLSQSFFKSWKHGPV
jgi:hypothetical protein